MNLLLRTRLVAVVATGLAVTAAFAQSANYSSAEAVAGKLVQLGYYASAHKNCTPAEAPTVRVLMPPQHGTLSIRKAVLSTNKVAGCPGLKTPTQVAFYLANDNYVGPDKVSFEVTAEDGEVATYEITITVKAAPPASPPDGEAKGKSL
jgi:hypothetical protein